LAKLPISEKLYPPDRSLCQACLEIGKIKYIQKEKSVIGTTNARREHRNLSGTSNIYPTSNIT
jgi:hypothetical protein